MYNDDCWMNIWWNYNVVVLGSDNVPNGLATKTEQNPNVFNPTPSTFAGSSIKYL